jgi:ribonuclease G
LTSELLFSRGGGRLWAAIREGGEVVELRVERERETLAVGRIVKARVSRILPGIQAAFLDVGQDREAFLHANDLLVPGEPVPQSEADLPRVVALEEDADGDSIPPPASERARRESHPRDRPIEARLRTGDELVVQIVREAMGNKGPRASCFASLPGRHLVYMPRVAYRAISRRIEDAAERERLRSIVEALGAPSGGFIARTASAGVAEEPIRADADTLVEEWEAIERAAAAARSPALLHADHDLVLRMVRDADREAVERIVTDDADLEERIRLYLERVEPSLAHRVRYHGGPDSLFDALGIAADVERALRPRVFLRSGGTVVLEPTEALVSIDVNSGKFAGAQGPEETALRTNLEAAEEIARQLRLRDLGGIIVIDFIDMERPESRRRVLEALESALSRDRARTKIVGLSDLGLVQLTRKRTRAGFAQALTEACPCCRGQGRVKCPEVVAGEALREAARLLRAVPAARATVRAHPEVVRAVQRLRESRAPGFDPAAGEVAVEADPASAPDRFDVSVL